MDYEKKYKEALEKAKEFYALCEKCGAKDTVDFLEDSFPELKESEDEKVEKAIFGMVYDSDNELWSSYDVSKSDVLAWLEKQGEEKISDKAESMKHGYMTTNPEFFQWIYDRLKYVYNENPNVDYMLSLKERIEDMQKFADKIGPKFKVGDWIVSNVSHEDYRICKILNNDGEYVIESIYGYRGHNNFETFDKDYHLWSIKDAKDGDILATDDGICIFDGTVEEGKYPFAYCGITERGFGSYDVKLPFSHDNNVHPATKEQRDTLLKAMIDAGYEWDAEKKELRLLITNGDDFFESENCEQKPNLYFKAKDWYVSKVDGKIHNIYNSVDKIEPKFHEGDIIQFNGFGHNRYTIKNVCGLSHYINTIGEKMDMSYTDANFEVIKDSDKNKLCRAWSEEDDYNVQCLVAKANSDIQKGNVGRNEELIDWLKSIKDRVQPKQEWNKGDMEMLNAAISFVEKSSFTTIGKGKNNTVSWLKSLKSRVIPQSRQEWSKEDEKNLQGIIDEIQANKNNAPSYDIPVYEGYLNWLKSLSSKK